MRRGEDSEKKTVGLKGGTESFSLNTSRPWRHWGRIGQESERGPRLVAKPIIRFR